MYDHLGAIRLAERSPTLILRGEPLAKARGFKLGEVSWAEDPTSLLFSFATAAQQCFPNFIPSPRSVAEVFGYNRVNDVLTF